MRVCKACNSFFEDEGAFCALCGSKTIGCKLTDSTPAEEPLLEDIVSSALPPVSKMPVIMSYIALASAITSLLLAIVGFYVYSKTLGYYHSAFEFFTNLCPGVLALGGAIASRCIFSSVASSGYSSGILTATKILSIFALVLSIIVSSLAFGKVIFSEHGEILKQTSYILKA